MVSKTYSADYHEAQHSEKFYAWPCLPLNKVLEKSLRSPSDDKNVLYTFLLETIHLTNELF